MKLRKQLAQQIVTSIKDVCQQDINFINTKGI
ncbi:sugar diacid recognition domain-containing protein, partial [Streptococcus agalactiae]